MVLHHFGMHKNSVMKLQLDLNKRYNVVFVAGTRKELVENESLAIVVNMQTTAYYLIDIYSKTYSDTDIHIHIHKHTQTHRA